MQPTSQNLRDPVGRLLGTLVETIRLGRTAGAVWQGLCHGARTLQARAFQGIGITARPPSGQGIAIAVYPEGGAEPVIVAASNPEHVFAVQADETALHNSTTVIYIRRSGVVDIRPIDGTAVPLATLDDVRALRDYVNVQVRTHFHTAAGGVTGSPQVGQGPMPAPPNPAGTSHVRAS